MLMRRCYGPYRPPIWATATSRKRHTSTTEAMIGSGQMLNLATLAAGEVTPGQAVKSTAVVGATARTTWAERHAVTLDLRGSAQCVHTSAEANSASPIGPTIPAAPRRLARVNGLGGCIAMIIPARSAGEKANPPVSPDGN